jgi:hypothetical protein
MVDFPMQHQSTDVNVVLVAVKYVGPSTAVLVPLMGTQITAGQAVSATARLLEGGLQKENINIIVCSVCMISI